MHILTLINKNVFNSINEQMERNGNLQVKVYTQEFKKNNKSGKKVIEHNKANDELISNIVMNRKAR